MPAACCKSDGIRLAGSDPGSMRVGTAAIPTAARAGLTGAGNDDDKIWPPRILGDGTRRRNVRCGTGGSAIADADPLHARLQASGHSRLVLCRAGEGLFQSRRPRRQDRPGRRLGRDHHAHHVGRLRRGLRRHERHHPDGRQQAGRSAGDGLSDLQPAALRARHQGERADQDHQGHRGQEARRSRRQRDAATAAEPRQGQQARHFQDRRS